jgi:hypothetical protein
LTDELIEHDIGAMLPPAFQKAADRSAFGPDMASQALT